MSSMPVVGDDDGSGLDAGKKGLVKLFFELVKLSPDDGLIDNINVLVSVLESRGYVVTLVISKPKAEVGVKSKSLKK